MWPSQYPLKDLDSSMGSSVLTRMLTLTYKPFSPLQILCRLPSPEIKVAIAVYNDCPPSYIAWVWSGRDEKRLATHLGSSRREGELQGSGCWGTVYPRALPSKDSAGCAIASLLGTAEREGGEGVTILFSFASLNISREGSHLGLHRTGQEQFTTHKWPAAHQTTKAKMQQELTISPLAIISLYFGALGKSWKEAGLNNVSSSAITQHEGPEPYINGSVMLKGKGLEQSPLYF